MTEAPDTQPMPQPATAGALLREARESRGIPIEKLASSIKISVQQLRDLEDDHYDRLSDAAFVRALAMSVCRSLGIDPQGALSLLPAPASVKVLESVNRGINAPFEAEGGGGMMVEARHVLRGLRGPIVLVALAGIVAWLIWPRLQSLQPRQPSAVPSSASQPASPPAAGSASEAPVQSSSAPVSQGALAVLAASAPVAPGEPASQGQPRSRVGQAAATSSASGAPVPPAPAAAVAVAPPAARSSAPVAPPQPTAAGAVVPLRVTARDSSWVEVRDASGRILLSRLLGAQESVSLQGVTPLRVTVGNALATDLSFNGHAVDLAPFTHDHVAHLELK